MEIRYFRTAWDDLRQSPGWFGKIVLLALLNLIPIFGQIVSLGYLYGWAREIAWNVHEPLPERIFGNEDGKLYRRGFFVLVVQVVYLIIPVVLLFVGAALTGLWSDVSTDMQYGSSYPYSYYSDMAPVATYRYFGWGALAFVASIVLYVLLQLFSWAGTMRTSVYNRVSAGLQFGRIWKMVRKDARGMLRIFGIEIVFVLIEFAFSTVLSVLAIVASVGSVIAIGVGSMVGSAESALLAVVAPIVLVLLAITALGSAVIEMIASAVVIRACGYWTSQFDVPSWRGQDEPMPFEEGAPTAAYYAPWSGYAASGGTDQRQGQPQAQYQQPPQAQYQQPPQAPYQQPYQQPTQQSWTQQQAPQQPSASQPTSEPSASQSAANGYQGEQRPANSVVEAAESMATAAAAGTKVPEARSVTQAVICAESAGDGAEAGSETAGGAERVADEAISKAAAAGDAEAGAEAAETNPEMAGAGDEKPGVGAGAAEHEAESGADKAEPGSDEAESGATGVKPD